MKTSVFLLAVLTACGSQAAAPTTQAQTTPAAETPAPQVAAKADDTAIVIGHKHVMTSAVLGEERPYLVYLPRGYEQNEARYPVVYLLDGDGHFHHATGIVQFLQAQGRMPGVIVVGIPNTVRSRDLTPTETDRAKPSGGADAFLRFIETELIGEINTRYRTAPLKILVGHSFGGLFAVHALTSRLGLFDAHIAAASSLQWDGELMAKRIEPMLSKPLTGFLYFSLGNEPEDITRGNKNFAALLEKSAPDSLRWKFDHMMNEDHGSVVHRTMYRGLEMFFAGWRLPANTATVADVKAHYEAVAKHYRIEARPPEGVVNILGYRQLQAKPPNVDAALELFRFNIELYPDSANVYDSLGEAYEKVGKLEEAHGSYSKAVERSKPGEPFHEVFIKNRDRAAKALGK